MTNEEIVAMATTTKTSKSTGNTVLEPHVAVAETATGEVLHVSHIGVRHKDRGYVRTEKGWIRPERLSAIKPA